MDRWYVASSVGTSVLSNYLILAESRDGQEIGDLRRVLRETSNKKETEVTAREKEVIDRFADRAKEWLEKSPLAELPRRSAELNGICSFYGERMADSRKTKHDRHVLLATDTYQGSVVAGILAHRLEQLGFVDVTVRLVPGLSAASEQGFRTGCANLVEWCMEEVDRSRQSGYRVVFNLVGGYKGVQGYLSSLGMLYADEIIYIFEGPSAALIRIPRIPVTLRELDRLRDYRAQLLLLEREGAVSRGELAGLPETLLEMDPSGQCTLSPWGKAAWDRNRDEILAQSGPVELPGLEVTKSFEKDFEDHVKDSLERVKVQETLAKVASLWRKGSQALREDAGLQYKSLQGKKGVDYFRVSQSLRVTCRPEGSKLVLRHVGPKAQVLQAEGVS